MDLLLSQLSLGFQNADRTLAAWSDQVANVATPGFQALAPYAQALPDTPVNAVVSTSAGAMTLTVRDTAAGALEPTGSPLDVAIDGTGYFAVEKGGTTYYTRLGAFRLDASGRLVLPDGSFALGVDGRPITVPAGADQVSIGVDGTVSATSVSGQAVTAGRLSVVRFRNPEGLQSVEAGLLVPTADSGPAVPVRSVALRTGALEASNVDLARALVGVMQAAEAFRAQAEMATVDSSMQSRLDQLVS